MINGNIILSRHYSCLHASGTANIAYRERTASLGGTNADRNMRITGHACLKIAGYTFKIYFVPAINRVDVCTINL